jgi:hypothetical protein
MRYREPKRGRKRRGVSETPAGRSRRDAGARDSPVRWQRRRHARQKRHSARALARARKARRDWRPAFLKGFANSGTVAGGCANARIYRSTAYRERERDPRFAVKWAELEEQLTDKLEARAVEMALDGEYHTLHFLLKARRPDVYREHIGLEHSGQVTVDPLGDLSNLSDRELTSLQRLLEKARGER